MRRRRRRKVLVYLADGGVAAHVVGMGLFYRDRLPTSVRRRTLGAKNLLPVAIDDLGVLLG